MQLAGNSKRQDSLETKKCSIRSMFYERFFDLMFIPLDYHGLGSYMRIVLADQANFKDVPFSAFSFNCADCFLIASCVYP